MHSVRSYIMAVKVQFMKKTLYILAALMLILAASC